MKACKLFVFLVLVLGSSVTAQTQLFPLQPLGSSPGKIIILHYENEGKLDGTTEMQVCTDDEFVRSVVDSFSVLLPDSQNFQDCMGITPPFYIEIYKNNELKTKFSYCYYEQVNWAHINEHFSSGKRLTEVFSEKEEYSRRLQELKEDSMVRLLSEHVKGESDFKVRYVRLE